MLVPAFRLPGTRGLENVHWAVLLNEGNSRTGLANCAELRPVATMSDFRSQSSPIHPSKQDTGAFLQPHLKEESDFWASMEKPAPADEAIIPEISDDLIEILKSRFPSMDGSKIATAVHTIAREFNNDSSPCDSQSTIPSSPAIEFQIPDCSRSPVRGSEKRMRAPVTNTVGGMLSIPVGIQNSEFG